jgi:hypothetical protein
MPSIRERASASLSLFLAPDTQALSGFGGLVARVTLLLLTVESTRLTLSIVERSAKDALVQIAE